MVSQTFIMTATIDFVTLLASTPGNLFILVVIFLDVAKSRSLDIIYHLICGITFLNILQQLVHFAEDILVFITVDEFSVATTSKLILAFDLVCYLCNSYFFAWLCVYFCLKIVNINQKFYIFLQKRFHRTFKFILISTIVVSVVLSFLSLMMKPNGSIFNITLGEDKPSVTSYYKYLSCVDISGTPILLSFVMLSFSAVAVVFSLVKHMKTVRNNIKSSRSPSMEAHVKATQTIVSLLTVNLVYFGVGLFYFLLGIHDIYNYVSSICAAVYFVLAPILLIKGNSKLQKRFYKLFKSTQQ